MSHSTNSNSFYIIYDEDLTPVEVSDQALTLQDVKFDDFRYFGKKENILKGNLGKSMDDFLSDNERALSGENLVNLDGFFYKEGFRSFFTRRYPIFSKNLSQKIIGIEVMAFPVVNLFYPEINSIIKSNAVQIHQNVIENFNEYFKSKRDSILTNKWNLSQRELDCIYYVVSGLTNTEIGKILCISPRTVDTHIEHIKDKMGIKNKRDIFEKMSKILLTNF